MKVSILVKRPNEEPEEVEIENTFEEVRKLVGGYVKVINLRGGSYQIFCDEDGKLKGLKGCAIVGNVRLVGNLVFAHLKRNGTIGALSDVDKIKLLEELKSVF